MATKIRHYESSFTLDDLNTTCNTDEDDIGGQLQSLEAVQNTNGVKTTEAIFDKAKNTGLGNVTIKKAPSGTHTAFIMTVKTKVSISRD
jgi:hypothetical protein